MILVIEGRRYPVVHIAKLSLKHALFLQQELAVMDPPITECRTWGEIRELWVTYAKLTKADQRAHTEGAFLTALTIWAARVATGEDITLMDAIDTPVSEIQWVTEPGDHAGGPEGKAKGPRRAAAGGGRRGKGKRRH